MKYIVCLFSMFFLWYSCVSNQTTNTVNDIDPLTASFVTNKLCKNIVDSNKLILLINPSFCGSCTEKIRQFAQQIMQLPCAKCLVLSTPDSLLQQAVKNSPNTALQFTSADTLARYNLLTPYSKLYFVKDSFIAYNKQLIEEELPFIWQEFTKTLLPAGCGEQKSSN
ncbi:hypothetical protein C7N43_04425 [Sphingobacteriales bacterium UPWRP_1]|nr:hypothetical protein B6N25_04960 [Sphingobacteriales bacterium TSM_CSS]PSJ78310.1 hypothetical protein C7N43_04425 [Sphingobacteriales bacterium UPWRP_1]